jgi:hypothetical protein
MRGIPKAVSPLSLLSANFYFLYRDSLELTPETSLSFRETQVIMNIMFVRYENLTAVTTNEM